MHILFVVIHRSTTVPFVLILCRPFSLTLLVVLFYVHSVSIFKIGLLIYTKGIPETDSSTKNRQ